LEAAILRQDPKLDVQPVTVIARPPSPAAPVTSFVGRDEKVGQLIDALDGSRLITVTGIGGAGKTRLAREVAWRVHRNYPEGVVFVDLANTPSAGVARRVADAVGVFEENDAQLLGSMLAALERRNMLLVLDSCERAVTACAALVANLIESCPRLRIIATSRQPLGVYGETRLQLLPLPTPPPIGDLGDAELASLASCPSIELLVSRAAAVKPDYRLMASNARSLAQICVRLDGIPLALELAAARLAILTPDELVAGLGDRFPLLSAAPRTFPARHQTLRAALDWSYELLEEEEQTAFRRFSVFLSGVSLALAGAVCSVESGRRVVDVLTALVEKSLVIRSEHGGETRLTMHETVREYARDLLIARSGQGSARAAHCQAICALAEQHNQRFHGPDEEAALDVLRHHQPDLGAALTWSAAHDRGTAHRMIKALWWYWFRTNRTQEGRKWIESVVPANVAGDIQPDASFALSVGSYFAWIADDFDTASSAATQALHMPQCSADTAGMAHSVLARIAGDLDRFTEALDAARRGEESYASIGDSWGVLWCRRCRAAAFLYCGQLAEARVLAEECLHGFEMLGDAWGVAGSIDLLAAIAHRAGDDVEAIRLATRAVEQHRAFEDTSGTKYALHHLAEAAYGAGDHQLAFASATASLELSEQHGYRFGVMHALLLLGQLQVAVGDRVQAIALTKRAQHLAHELNDVESEREATRRLTEWQASHG
jgi:predicted ATPase